MRRWHTLALYIIPPFFLVLLCTNKIYKDQNTNKSITVWFWVKAEKKKKTAVNDKCCWRPQCCSRIGFYLLSSWQHNIYNPDLHWHTKHLVVVESGLKRGTPRGYCRRHIYFSFLPGSNHKYATKCTVLYRSPCHMRLQSVSQSVRPPSSKCHVECENVSPSTHLS